MLRQNSKDFDEELHPHSLTQRRQSLRPSEMEQRAVTHRMNQDPVK